MDLAVLGFRLDWMLLEAFSNLSCCRVPWNCSAWLVGSAAAEGNPIPFYTGVQRGLAAAGHMAAASTRLTLSSSSSQPRIN